MILQLSLPISIRDNVLFAYNIHSKGERQSRSVRDDIVESALRQVLLWDEVKDRLNRKATELSLEEQQKLCIARLLPVKPSVLLMDDTQEIRLTKHQRHWLEHLRACDASGKGIAEYAAAHRLDAKAMYAGKKVLVK